MKSHKTFFFLTLFLVVSLASNVLALGVTPGKVNLIFKKDLKTTISFNVLGADDPAELENYIREIPSGFENTIKLNEIKKIEDKVTFSVDLDLSKADIDKIRPGDNRLVVGVREIAPGEGQFAALVAIQIPIIVFVPVEGIYFDVSLDVKDALMGEQGQVSATIRNLGKEKITITPTFIILEGNVEKLILPSNQITLDINEEKTITQTFDTSDFKEGKYRVKFTARMKDFSVEKVSEFRIGKWELEVASVKQLYSVNKIEQFVMQVRNKWNDEAKDVEAEVKIQNQTTEIASFITPRFNVPASETNQTKEIKQYFDTTGVAIGKYKMNVSLHFNNEIFSHAYDVEFIEKKFNLALWVGIVLIIFVLLVIILRFIRHPATIKKKRKK